MLSEFSGMIRIEMLSEVPHLPKVDHVLMLSPERWFEAVMPLKQSAFKVFEGTF